MGISALLLHSGLMLSQVGTGAPARITCHHCGLKKPWTGEADWTDCACRVQVCLKPLFKTTPSINEASWLLLLC